MLSKNSRQQAVDEYTETHEYERYNIAHIVLDDGNVDTDSINFALNYIDENRETYKKDHEGVTDSDIDETRKFLVSLLDIPYHEDRE